VSEVKSTEDVWQYPRPPRVEATSALVEIEHDGQVLACTRRALRVLETSHPPAYYLPSQDVDMSRLRPVERRSYCEFKGSASYWALDGQVVAWSYPEPTSEFQSLAGYLAFYPSRLDQCRVNGERVQAQVGDFYGGWITSNLKGPFKGAPGTSGW
jgi:uncharacterized protein (DUF427 family)